MAVKIVLSHKIKNESENNKQVLSLFAPVTNYLTVFSVALLVFTTACSPKDRKSQLSPSEEKDLLLISDFDQKEFELKDTIMESELESKKQVSTANTHNLDKKFGYVKFSTDSTLMNEVPVIGESEKNYKIRYVIDGKWLRIYKVSTFEDLSENEKTYSTPVVIIENKMFDMKPESGPKVSKDKKSKDKQFEKKEITKNKNWDSVNEQAEKSNDKLTIHLKTYMRTPLVSYPVIGFYRINTQKDQNGDSTSRLELIAENNKDTATHFKMDLLGREIFKDLKKSEYFPKNYFNGDWYYGSTTHYTSYQADNKEISLYHKLNNGYYVTGKIKFVFTNDEVIALDLNAPPEIVQRLFSEKSPKLKTEKEIQDLQSLLIIPADYKNFKEFTSNNSANFNEEPDKETTFDNANYVYLNLRKSITPFLNSDRMELTDVIMEPDYFSFSLLDKNTGIKNIHAFYRTTAYKTNPNNSLYADKPYQKTYSTKEVEKKFGIFTTTKENLPNSYENETYKQKTKMLIRFNPDRKKIVYYFSKSTPDWVKPVAIKAVQEWNQGLKWTGSKTEITVDESKTVNVGDIRYNILNISADKNHDDFAFGYGPLFEDSSTGETISAITNVNLYNMQNYSENYIIKSYLEFKLGRQKSNSTLFITAPNDLKQKFGTIEKSNLKNSNTGSSLSDHKSKSMSFFDSTNLSKINQLDQVDFSLLSKSLNPRFAKFNYSPEKILSIHSENQQGINFNFQNVVNIIENNKSCELIKNLAENTNNTNTSISKSIETAFQILTEKKQTNQKDYLNCIQDILNPAIKNILLHELGHNLGLKHNFAASADYRNYKYDSKNNILMKSSSVMDYLNEADEFSKEISLGKYDLYLIKYLYTNVLSNDSFLNCDDSDLKYGNNILCQKYDTGKNPTEIVNSFINLYYYLFSKSNLSAANNHFLGFNDPFYIRYHLLFKIKDFYDEWRFQLSRFISVSDFYLEKWDEKSFQNWIVSEKNKNSEFKKIYDFYYPAAETAFMFLNQLAFLPDHYCVVKDGKNNLLGLYPFTYIYNTLDNTKEKPIQCNDEVIKTELKKIFPQAEMISNWGYAIHDYYSSPYQDKYTEQPSSWGIESDRYLAIGLLTTRFTRNYNLKEKGLLPNFLDDPRFKLLYETEIINRISKGVTYNQTSKNPVSSTADTISDQNKKQNYLFFTNEAEILENAYYQLIKASFIPLKEELNNFRSQRYILVNKEKIRETNKNDAIINSLYFNGVLYVPTPNGVISNELLNIYGLDSILKTAFENKNYLVDFSNKSMAVLNNFTNLKTITVPNLNELFSKLNTFSKNNSYLNKEILKTYFGSEYKNLNDFLNILQSNESFTFNEDQTNLNLLEYVKTFPVPNGGQLNLSKIQKELNNTSKLYLTRIDQYGKTYERNQMEYYSRINLIFSILKNSIYYDR